MKKHFFATVLIILTVGAPRTAQATESNLVENAAWLFGDQSAAALGMATGTGLAAYFLADIYQQSAEKFDTLLEREPSMYPLKKSTFRTLAFLARAVHITGKLYAVAAISSLPIRYVVPILGEENVKEALKNMKFNFVLFADSHRYY